jgi:TRAP-type C4-dicarboxylate transport system permease small subunit
MLRAARRVVLACSTAMAVVAMVIIGLMMLTITYDVLVRFVFLAPTDWAYPLNSAGVLASTSLAVPYLYATQGHIAMDLLHRALPRRWRRISDGVTAAASALLGVLLAITAFRAMGVAVEGGLIGSGTFNIPLWIPDAVLGLTGVFLALAAVLFPAAQPEPDAATVPEAQDERSEVAD